MAGIHERYTREMYDEFGHFACWTPDSKLTLGDVGTLRGRRFDKFTSLAELGVTFEENEVSAAGDLEYATAGHVEVRMDGDAADEATVSITFTVGGATFFQAANCMWLGIAGLPAIEKQLLDLPGWRSEYIVVTKLLRTGPAVVLVSKDKGARVELRLSTDALAGPVPIAKAHAGLAFANRSSIAARLSVYGGATPLFQAMHLRRPLVGQRRMRWRGGDSPSLALTDVTWDDYAEDA